MFDTEPCVVGLSQVHAELSTMVKHSPLYPKVKGLSHAVAGTKRENGGTNSRETINT